MTAKKRSRVRTYCLLGALALVLVVAATQRSLLVKIPYGQAYRCLRDRNFESAQWWLDIASYIAPQDAERHFIAGRIWRRKDQMGRMADSLAQAKAGGFSPQRLEREEWLAGAQEGRMRQADTRLVDLLADAQGEELEICEAFVVGFIKARHYQIAHTLLAEWEKDFPKDPHPHFLRATLYSQDRRWSDAEENLETALALNAKHTDACLLMGEVLLDDKRPEEAISFFERAEAAPALRAAARLGQAKSLAAMGQTEAAQELLDELLSADPDFREAAVARAQLEMSQGQYAAALARLDPFLKQSPFDLDLRYAHATALRGVGRDAEALAEFDWFARTRANIDRAAKLKERAAGEPGNTALPFEIGSICLQSGMEKEGVLWMEMVLEMDPKHVGAHRALADYYFEHREQAPHFRELAKQHKEAAESLERESQPSGAGGKE